MTSKDYVWGPSMSSSTDMKSEAQARAMLAVLGKAENEFAASITAPVLGEGMPPENYDFRGISGGPMLSVIECRGLLRSWALAGVIYEGPNPSPDPDEAIGGLEIIRARRAHFILPDGTLDTRRWEKIAAMRCESGRP